MNIDVEPALIGASNSRRAVKKIVSKARRVLGKVDEVENGSDLRYLCRVFKDLTDEFVELASHNVDIASKTGGLPTRYLGIDSGPQIAGGIPAGGTLGVLSNPSVVVRIVVIRTDDTFASDFNIDDISVATMDLVVGARACPSTMFTAGICLPPTSAPILPAGSSAETDVQNIGGAARRFRGGFGIIKLTNPEC